VKKGDLYNINISVEHESILISVVSLSSEQKSERVVNWRNEAHVGNIISEMIAKMKHDEDSRGGS
jgi:hypothetical protein